MATTNVTRPFRLIILPSRVLDMVSSPVTTTDVFDSSATDASYTLHGGTSRQEQHRRHRQLSHHVLPLCVTGVLVDLARWKRRAFSRGQLLIEYGQ